MKTNLSAIVIGSGVAGLASAIRLAVQGIAVIVLEKNGYAGGKLSHFEKEGFQFDAGPSLFTQPQHIKALFAVAGERMEDHFQYRSIPIGCKYFYEDGSVVNAFANTEKFAQELSNKLGEDPIKVKKYLLRSKQVYDDIGAVFLNYSLHQLSSLLKAPLVKAIRAVKWHYIFGSLNDVNTSSFTKPHTVQLFNRYATYNGSNPYKAPGMLCLIPHLEHNEGTFYPKGGMISITNALYELAVRKGVKFQFDTSVQQIMLDHGKVKGVVANGAHFNADLVVSNMDVYGTYKYLLNDAVTAKKLLKQERSSSALVFYWGMAKEFPRLELHNIFFSAQYETEFDHLFRTKSLYSDPTVYINITSKCEPGMQAPEGNENWFVMVNAPANTGQDWDTIKKECRANIIAKINRSLQMDIEPLIVVEETLDPIMIEARTSSFMGSLYGTSSNSRMAAFLRHANFSKQIKGLYFAGGSVHPGGGIPLCLLSAKIMCEMVQQDHMI